VKPKRELFVFVKTLLQRIPFSLAHLEVGVTLDGGLDVNWVDAGVYCTFCADSEVSLALCPPKPKSTLDITAEDVSLADIAEEQQVEYVLQRLCPFLHRGFALREACGSVNQHD
jgi:hypothetical protein